MLSGELLVIGDVHGMWDDVDRAFLEAGEQDLAVFVGDFGEEDVALIGRIAALGCAKVVLLGNHDAWYGMRRGGDLGKVREQLALLGDDHLAFRARRPTGRDYALIGARPFSWGGGWRFRAEFYAALYGMTTNGESADAIAGAAAAVPGVPLVVVGHNGPRGLGAGRDAIYGRDFRKPHIDFGDPDFEYALDRLRAADREVVATVAGHMHDRLRGGGLRCRAVASDGAVHLNAAVVPRHREVDGRRQRHFLRVRLEPGRVAATDLWVGEDGRVEASEELAPAHHAAAS